MSLRILPLVALVVSLAAFPASAFEVSVVHGQQTLSGVVTYAEPSANVFFIATDGGDFWRCSMSSGGASIVVGDVVNVSGDVLPQTVNNRIDYCEAKVVGHDESRVPESEHVSISQLNAHPASGSAEPDRFARLVSVAGRVVDVNRRLDTVQTILSDGEKCVGVNFRMKSDTPLAEGLAIGAIVRAKGVYVYVTEPRNSSHPVFAGISGPLVMLASPDDLEVLTRPPFWTPLRARIAVGMGAFLGFGLVFWVVSLRRTVSRQVKVIEKALREKAAADGARRERLRLSHDLHDDFQQLLSGTMFRISAALNWLAEGDSPRAKEQLEKATANLVHTQSQLRTVLWGLQEESEGPRSLMGLFHYAAGRMAHWEGIVEITSTGSEPALARTLAGGLLMILQEAVGNAIRHGRAKRVTVNVAFGDGRLTLTVADDGCGFDTVEHARGLGLGSMDERAKALGGSFRIESSPNAGAKVTVEIPI